MFNIIGCYFKYGLFDSSNYSNGCEKLVFANMDTDRLLSLHGEQKVETVYSKRNVTHYMTKTYLSPDQFSFEAEIMTENAVPIRSNDLAIVERALFYNQSNFIKLYSLEDYNAEGLSTYINCIFTNPERIDAYGGIVGYKFTVVTDSPLAWEDEQTVTPDIISASEEGSPEGLKRFDITVSTDLEEYIYPSVTINMGSSGGDLVMYNTSDNASRFIEFDNLPQNARITMDSRINYLSEDYYASFVDRNFIRLVDGVNHFAFTGDLDSISFTFNNRKFF